MPQMTIRRPFGELDLGDQLGFEPDTVFHFFPHKAHWVRFFSERIIKTGSVDRGASRGPAQDRASRRRLQTPVRLIPFPVKRWPILPPSQREAREDNPHRRRLQRTEGTCLHVD